MNKTITPMKSSFEAAFTPERFVLAAACLGAAFLILVVRLYYVQVVRGEEYLAKSESNFIQERRIAHARGLIYDQTGRTLVDNRPSHDVFLTVAFLPDSTRTLKMIAPIIGIGLEDVVDIDKHVLQAVEDPAGDHVVVREHVDERACKEMEAQLAKKPDLRGVRVRWGWGAAGAECDVVLAARAFPSRPAVFRRLREVVGLPKEDMDEYVKKALEKSRGLGKFKAAQLLEDIPYEAYARIEAAASLGDLPGIDITDSQKRRYREKSRAAHVLGYMNELSVKEMEARKEDSYRLGDLVGRTGIESSYERDLRGKDGVKKVVVDAKGRDKGERLAIELLGDARIEAPESGHSLVLSIDETLQETAERSFLGIAGSVVAMEVDTGFIVAMASFPAYDPNLITGPWSREEKRRLNQDPNRPWTNKAMGNHYAPGSTFKAITAAAGLRNKLITVSSTRACPGFFRLGSSSWRCYNRSGHGPIALVKALQASCDSYFYSVGHELGADRLAETARLFGFGGKTGIDIDGEIPGIMPDRAYYVRRFGANNPGLVVNSSIGQGDVTVTPLQLATAYAALANGGTIYKPQVVREVRSADGRTVAVHDPVALAKLDMTPEQVAMIKEALSHVTEGGGTAAGLNYRKDFPEASQWLRESGVKIVGKTGTAQVTKLAKNIAHLKVEETEYLQRDHAWFVGFSPQEKPEIVVVTMTEHGGFGGSTSGPVVLNLLFTYFQQVRGTGRYASLPALPPPPKRPRQPPPKVEINEESAPHPEHEGEAEAPPPAPPEGPR